MSDLSPAAEAVLNAVTLNRYDAPYYACPKSIGQIKSDVAAALRAATNDWRVDTEFMGGVEYIRTSTLDAIAAELEALPND
jgi:hypothetical protein